jgi:hypothetical protein
MIREPRHNLAGRAHIGRGPQLGNEALNTRQGDHQQIKTRSGA